MKNLTVGKAKDAAIETLKSMIDHYHRLSDNYEIGSDPWFNLMIKINDLQQKIASHGYTCEVV